MRVGRIRTWSARRSGLSENHRPGGASGNRAVPRAHGGTWAETRRTGCRPGDAEAGRWRRACSRDVAVPWGTAWGRRTTHVPRPPHQAAAEAVAQTAESTSSNERAPVPDDRDPAFLSQRPDRACRGGAAHRVLLCQLGRRRDCSPGSHSPSSRRARSASPTRCHGTRGVLGTGLRSSATMPAITRRSRHDRSRQPRAGYGRRVPGVGDHHHTERDVVGLLGVTGPAASPLHRGPGRWHAAAAAAQASSERGSGRSQLQWPRQRREDNPDSTDVICPAARD